MNTFRHLKVAGLDPDAGFVLNYTPPSVCRLKTITFSALNNVEFDVYFGNNSVLNLSYTIYIGAGTTAYTLNLSPALMVSANSLIRVVFWNRHSAAQNIAITLGLSA